MDITINTDVLRLLLDIAIICLVVYLAFFKSYIQEKGKNLATKEDIREITQTVEEVKNDLRVVTESKLSLREEERQALVDFYIKYHAWFSAIHNVRLSDVNEDRREQFDEIRNQLSLANFEFELARGRMELFIDNSQLKEAIFPALKKAIEFQHLVDKTILDLKMVFLEIDQMRNATPLQDQPGAYRPLLQKRSEVLHEFRTKLLELYAVCLPLKENLRAVAYSHLTKLTSA